MCQGPQSTSPVEQTLVRFDYDRSCGYGVWGSYALHVWRGAVEEHHMPLMEQRWSALAKDVGTIGLALLILPSAPLPSNTRRQQITASYERLEKRIKAVGAVVEGRGLNGTAGALFMTRMLLMSNPTYAYKNGTRVPDIARWLVGKVGHGSPQGLEAAIDRLRNRYARAVMRDYRERLSPN